MKKRTKLRLKKRWAEIVRFMAKKPHSSYAYHRPMTWKEQQQLESRILRQMSINFQL